jgi:predicted nucleotidyltransferase
MKLIDYIQNAGFPYVDNVILTFTAGSALHGARAADAKADLDIAGVYVEPQEKILGIDHFEHFVCSTSKDDRRNTSDDVDIALYGLRKWAGMAAKQNATALSFLFCDPTGKWDSVWDTVREQRDLFLSQDVKNGFLGFASDQLKRMTGEKGRGKHGQRPELEAIYGYDVKAAMHTFRLIYECLELLEKGTLTYPRPEKDFLIQIRQGAWPLDKIVQEANLLFLKCHETKSILPEKIDRSAISRCIAEAYQLAWSRKGQAYEWAP